MNETFHLIVERRPTREETLAIIENSPACREFFRRVMHPDWFGAPVDDERAEGGGDATASER